VPAGLLIWMLLGHALVFALLQVDAATAQDQEFGVGACRF
jgi:hypothetical protein